MSRILVVDDAPYTYELLASSLEPDSHGISNARSLAEARQKFSNLQFDAVLTVQKLPDGDALGLLRTAHQVDPTLAVIFVATDASLEVAVESVRSGAFDFLATPLSSQLLRTAIQRACEHTAQLREKGNGYARQASLAWIETLPPSFDLRGLLSRVEKAVIERTLESTGGAQAEAARRLGLSRSDFFYKLLKYEF